MAWIEDKTLLDTPAPPLERPASTDRRNLRRADWRVLVPVPPEGFEHMVLLGGPKGLNDAIVEVGLARHVSTVIPSNPCADIVAILRDAFVECEEAAASLLPGGTLYWEVESDQVRGSWIRHKIKRTLLRARLSLTGLYWVRPDFERCEVFVPIEVRTAMEWYLRTWADTSSRLRRLLGSRLGAALGAGVIGPLLRRYAVTAVAGPVRDAGSSILSYPAVPVDFRRAGARPLVFNRGGRDGSRRVVVFPFREDSAEPVGVLKFSRLAERNADMEQEQKIAFDVRSRLDPFMRRSIPEPLGTFSWGQVVVGVETYAGRPISSHAPNRKRRRIEDLCLATRWLQEFHRQSQVSRDPFSVSQLQMYVERPLADYGAAFGNNPKEKVLFERVRESAQSLLGSPFPVVCSHWAFSEFNVCRSGDDISVIDWENVEIGPPLVDLIYFVTVWYYRSRQTDGQAARLDCFKDLFFPSAHDPLAALASAALDGYMKSLSIDRRFLPVMLVLTSVIRGLARLKRDRAFGELRMDPRTGNHVEFVRILTENQDRLFLENES